MDFIPWTQRHREETQNQNQNQNQSLCWMLSLGLGHTTCGLLWSEHCWTHLGWCKNTTQQKHKQRSYLDVFFSMQKFDILYLKQWKTSLENKLTDSFLEGAAESDSSWSISDLVLGKSCFFTNCFPSTPRTSPTLWNQQNSNNRSTCSRIYNEKLAESVTGVCEVKWGSENRLAPGRQMMTGPRLDKPGQPAAGSTGHPETQVVKHSDSVR